MSDVRRPNGETYALGHNEQMQVAIALSMVGEALRKREGGDSHYLTLDPDDFANLTLPVLMTFESLFSVPGLVTLVKELDDEPGGESAPDMPINLPEPGTTEARAFVKHLWSGFSDDELTEQRALSDQRYAQCIADGLKREALLAQDEVWACSSLLAERRRAT